MLNMDARVVLLKSSVASAFGSACFFRELQLRHSIRRLAESARSPSSARGTK